MRCIDASGRMAALVVLRLALAATTLAGLAACDGGKLAPQIASAPTPASTSASGSTLPASASASAPAAVSGAGGPAAGSPAAPATAAAVALRPAASAAARTAATRPHLPPPHAPSDADDLRLQFAQRLVAAHPDSTYLTPAPDRLLAIPVLEVELNADGSVRHIAVLRRPATGQDGNAATLLAIAAVRRAAPFGNVSRLPKPWKVVETFLFDDQLHFKPRTLDL